MLDSMKCAVCGKRSTIIRWSDFYQSMACWDCKMGEAKCIDTLKKVFNEGWDRAQAKSEAFKTQLKARRKHRAPSDP